jgi:hypothetical protein
MTNPVSINYYDMIVGFIIYNCYPYLSEIILYSLQLLGFRSFIIFGDKEKYKTIIKRLEKDTWSTSFIYRGGKELPMGYFLGKQCVGYYCRDSRYIDDEKIHIITTNEFYTSLCKDDIKLHSDISGNKQHEIDFLIDKENKQDKIKIFIRSGTYKSFYYISLFLNVSHINPTNEQQQIVDDIIRIYKKKERVATFIHGVSGAGKSTIGYMVAKELNGNFCHTFNPTDPGDNFCHLIHETQDGDNEDVPLIIVLEEVNQLIKSIHSKTLQKHNEIPISVYDKTTWCNFLDDMILYNKIILILTSNENKDTIDAMDIAYLRSRRIDSIYSMMTPLELPD